MNKTGKRLLYLSAFILTVLIEVYIAVFVHDRFIRPYLGDVLAVAAVYFFVRVFRPDGGKWLPLWVFIFAVCVEISQYFQLVKLLGMENNRVISIILGGVFDWADILCYAAGCLIIWGVSAGVSRISGKKRRNKI